MGRPLAPDDGGYGERARLHLDHEVAEGFARIDGSWLHWFGDADESWQSWPIHNVICVVWLTACRTTRASMDTSPFRVPDGG